MRYLPFAALVSASLSLAQQDSWAEPRVRGLASQRAIVFAHRHAAGWLAHADPVSGLLPRTTTGHAYWNAKDCAADNYPFLVLTALVTGNHHLERTVREMLATEQRLCNRVDSLPDDFVFATQSWRRREPSIDELVFGASEYAKDGLLPIVEQIGPSPWLDRMAGLVRDIWKHAAVESPAGVIPSRNVEVNGELLQTMSRLYWITRDARFAQWCFRLADHYLLHERLRDAETLSLRDHGCEILGGLSEAYVVAAHVDAARRIRYRPELHALLDLVLAHGVTEDGMMPNAFHPQTGEFARKGLSDGFGYVYDAFLTVAELDGVDRYRTAVAHVLQNVHRYVCRETDGMTGADGHADAIEGTLNLLARIPVESAFDWVDREIAHVFSLQRPDGIVEGWYGDGNSVRTALMYAFWKTQGVAPMPWRDDVRCGAVLDEDGTLRIALAADWSWSGVLRFDRRRHAELLGMPLDYPRINQFPEWFTVDAEQTWVVEREGCCPEVVRGAELRRYELTLGKGEEVRLTVRRGEAPPELRQARYTPRSADEARAWQHDLRGRLAAILRVDDLLAMDIPLEARETSRVEGGGSTLVELELQARPGRRIPALLSLPEGAGRCPAVVCIHGHGGTRRAVHDNQKTYRCFAAELAKRGYVTIAVDVGQHDVADGRTLIGERCWDLRRCVDYLETLPQVDPARIGCAGLSLGGEMAMWLAALDTRIRATVSSGFLTTMDQMEQHHCMCWKVEGLRELVDWADVYALIAPRPLQCQNGLGEGPRDFYVPLARRAMREIEPIYRDLGAPQAVELAVHTEGHVVELPALLEFFERTMG